MHASRGAWNDAITTGAQALKKSPGDTGVISEMASACQQLGHNDCALYYLRWALDVAPSDAEINKQAADLLESMGEFDQAIGCWMRVQQQKPADETAKKAIARLSVEKTIDDGKYNPQLLSGAAEVDVPTTLRIADASISTDKAAEEVAARHSDQETSEEALRAAIDNEPRNPEHYSSLADRYVEEGRLQDAETLLAKAIKVSDSEDIDLLEKLEEVHLTRMRHRAVSAKRRAEKQGSAAANKLAELTLTESHRAEAKVFGARARRDPGDPEAQYEFGLRLKRIGKFREAIKPLQAARSSQKRLAEVQLLLGECFQQIEQHQLAIRSYEASLAACDDDWSDLKKLAHYRAGVLAMGLGELEKAESHLTELAAADFGYRDVGERLDKIARIRQST